MLNVSMSAALQVANAIRDYHRNPATASSAEDQRSRWLLESATGEATLDPAVRQVLEQASPELREIQPSIACW